MDIGVCVASHIGDIDYVVQAERFGYSHAWLADSQMIWSDCYATLALAAQATQSIRLGTGVAVAGTRPPAVNAAGIATINALAPARTFMGIGAGNTAMRIMGEPPQRIAAFDRYLASLRPLLRGEESLVDVAGEPRPIVHGMPDRGFVNFEDPIPLYVSGFGPRSLGLAGQHGDGAVLAMPPHPNVMAHFWKSIEAGAARAGRSLDRSSFYMSALTTISLLDDGETLDSPRIREECGAFAMATVHFAYDQWRQFGHAPPAFLEEIWDEYCAMLVGVPDDRLHQRIHAGHNCWVLPEEERFVTPEIIDATCVVGRRDDVVSRLRALEEAGLDQVMILPAFEPRHSVLERVGNELIPQLA
ncbi:MAG: LLM class flavin-dependent oxidoreductase [Myxococcota bacterium]|jgi:alkanesulfonate monooxygenase SsuD/methylene tetrahydromethanopterin reductase-like flavin-dependent oxidoreductase (luciferase family)|nr:LLM class flavin-dependent oxidoreductase [Myxococcota bacterium]